VQHSNTDPQLDLRGLLLREGRAEEGRREEGRGRERKGWEGKGSYR